MKTIHLVGCGALGSVIAHEICKRSFSVKNPLKLHLYDSDEVSQRNVSAQNFHPRHVKMPKVEAVAQELGDYQTVEIHAHQIRVLPENMLDVIPCSPTELVIDAVDNIPTRQLLWQLGAIGQVPVLHTGMAQMGSGAVTWNYNEYDSFPLSPQHATQAVEEAAVVRATEKEQDEAAGIEELPPCELSARRSLILNTAMATVNAVFIFLGMDVTHEMQELHGGDPFPNLVTNWETTTQGLTCLKRRDMITVFEVE